MSDFLTVDGFEEVWRSPVAANRRRPEGVIHELGGGRVRARLGRLTRRAPEVMVKVTGRTRDAGHLRAHLRYISRHGALEMEDRDGARLGGREDVEDLAADWSALALADRRRRAGSPFSHSIVLSMPAGTDPVIVQDAARAFAQALFADRFDYAFVLHTDTTRPHVHMAVCSRGDRGERLNPKKSDLETWRQVFAQALGDRGVEAEATPRRARGVTRKAQRMSLRKIADRRRAGQGPPARRVRTAYLEAAKMAFRGDRQLRVWERRLFDRQASIRALYLAQAKLLAGSKDPADRDLGAEVAAWVRAMPAPESQRLALARELRAASRSRRPRAEREAPTPGPERNR